MAKKKSKKQARNNWQPRANDAINLAAIRWFANAIESKAIEVYATSPTSYPELEAALRKCVGAVAGVAKKPITGEDDCPPGWVMCGSDCSPMCLSD